MAYRKDGGGADYGDYDDDYGDNNTDRPAVVPEFDMSRGEYVVPDVVKTFVVYFYRHIREKNIYEIHQMYESSFNRLSERMFTSSPWPPVEAIAQFVDNDPVFCVLYKEMWFRHVYARLSPTLQHRCDSWDNYCNLFQIILHGNVNMQLPNSWLWDMISEFIYQFQSFCQYRARLKSRSEEELAILQESPNVWNVHGVLNYLLALINKSDIVAILDAERDTGELTFSATDGYDAGSSNVLKVLGYFSITGLVQVHSLLGDYPSAARCLSPVDVGVGGVYAKIVGCHVTTIYYAGFGNLMMRRYSEAITQFNKILQYIARTKQYHAKSPQYDLIVRKTEQIAALLAITLSLSPQMKLVDESVLTQLREKYAEKMTRMQRMEESVYDELFSFACPKFITPSAPNFAEPLVNYNQDAYRLQLKLFLTEVRQQQLVAGLRSFVQLYTSISIPKLATYMDVDAATLRSALLTYKHKMHVVESDGTLTSNADVEFYIDEDTVHICDVKSTRLHGDHFSRSIIKCEELVQDVNSLQLVA